MGTEELEKITLSIKLQSDMLITEATDKQQDRCVGSTNESPNAAMLTASTQGNGSLKENVNSTDKSRAGDQEIISIKEIYPLRNSCACAPVPYANAARERSRVKTLRSAFLDLQRALPCVPLDTKLSKLDILVLATTYIRQLMHTLDASQSQTRRDITWCDAMTQHFSLADPSKAFYHPVKKWPMRSRLYARMSNNPYTLSNSALKPTTSADCAMYANTTRTWPRSGIRVIKQTNPNDGQCQSQSSNCDVTGLPLSSECDDAGQPPSSNYDVTIATQLNPRSDDRQQR